MKVELTARRLLELVRLAIHNGNYQAALNLVDDALAQMPPDPDPPAGGEEKA